MDGKDFIGSASIGIAVYSTDGQDEETLLRNADTAMYAAKEFGCNTQYFSADMAENSREQLVFLKSRHCHEFQGFYLGRPTCSPRVPLRYFSN